MRLPRPAWRDGSDRVSAEARRSEGGKGPSARPPFLPGLRIVLQAGAWSRGLPVTRPQVRVFPPAAGAYTPIVTGTLFLHR